MNKILVIPIHALIIVLAYSSPFWLGWKLVASGVCVYWLQLLLFKHCVLSSVQFGDKETTFHEWYLAKIGIKPSHANFKQFLNIWAPLFLVIISLVVQVGFHLKPLVAI